MPDPQRGVVTLGESMVLFASTMVGHLWDAGPVRVSVAGSESNVAIGLRRLGLPATWIGRVGNDDLGTMVLRTLRAEDVTVLHTVDGNRTGVMIKTIRPFGAASVYYYREGSAGSTLCATDIPPDIIAAAGMLHITGITPALSVTSREAVRQSVEIARSRGVPISFDVNFRRTLWDADEARKPLLFLAENSDIIFADLDEAALLVGEASPTETIDRLSRLGPRQIVLKRGSRGVIALIDGGIFEQPALPVSIVDGVGAGDAFAAAYLAGEILEITPADRLRHAALSSALVLSTLGDWEGLPTRAELMSTDTGDGTVQR